MVGTIVVNSADWAIVEDGLASNFPHLSLLDSLNRQYVIGVKPGDHNDLFDWIKDSKPMVHQYTDDVGTLRGLFEKVHNRIDIGVWESWHHLYTCPKSN
jgi:hypothetical protein